jgi:PhzF family phenazine biosynthesis protein
MSVERRFSQLDVFTDQPLRGNPLAVVHDAGGLTDAQMAEFARWTNLSETTFLLAPAHPQADYRVRIFTPGGELPFAGHPTLGSCHAWLAAGGVARNASLIVQECGIGNVAVRRDGERLAFAAPPLRRSGPVDAATRARVVVALRIDPSDARDLQWIDNGPGWIGVLLRDAQAVLALRPDFGAMAELKIGAVGPYPDGAECAFEVRAFVPALAVPEDPVTGSLNAGLALWLIDAGLAGASYVVSQGTVLGRAGRVHVRREAGQTWVGGTVCPVVAGTVRL